MDTAGPDMAPSKESRTVPAFAKFAFVRWNHDASVGSKDETTPESVTAGGHSVA